MFQTWGGDGGGREGGGEEGGRRLVGGEETFSQSCEKASGEPHHHWIGSPTAQSCPNLSYMELVNHQVRFLEN